MKYTNKIALLKEMFDNMVVKKNASTIPTYYHPEFLLYSNGKTMDYAENIRFHEEVYQTPIQYSIAYDEETIVEQGDKVAARIWITTSKPDRKPTKIEVMIIAQYKQDKIYRAWELTYPNWEQMPEFTEHTAI
jgi:hypothetical protein